MYDIIIINIFIILFTKYDVFKKKLNLRAVTYHVRQQKSQIMYRCNLVYSYICVSIVSDLTQDGYTSQRSPVDGGCGCRCKEITEKNRLSICRLSIYKPLGVAPPIHSSLQ